jgi:hypothetical protein
MIDKVPETFWEGARSGFQFFMPKSRPSAPAVGGVVGVWTALGLWGLFWVVVWEVLL